MSTQANVPRNRPPLYDTLPVMLPDDHPKYRGMEFVPQRPLLVRGPTPARDPIKFDTGLQSSKLSRRLRLGLLSPRSTNTLVQYMTDYTEDSDDSMHHHMNGQLHKIWLVITVRLPPCLCAARVDLLTLCLYSGRDTATIGCRSRSTGHSSILAGFAPGCWSILLNSTDSS